MSETKEKKPKEQPKPEPRINGDLVIDNFIDKYFSEKDHGKLANKKNQKQIARDAFTAGFNVCFTYVIGQIEDINKYMTSPAVELPIVTEEPEAEETPSEEAVDESQPSQ